MTLPPRKVRALQAERASDHARYHAEERARASHFAQMEAEDKTPDGVPQDWFRYSDFVKYDPDTGQIIQAGRMSLAALDMHAQIEGGHWLRHEHAIGHQALLSGHWVDHARQAVRAKTEAKITVEGTTLKNLPVPCDVTVEIAGDCQTICCTDPNDPELELTFEHPGTYEVTVKAVRHHPKKITVTV